jgi:AcrR family transcriptional regulator
MPGQRKTSSKTRALIVDAVVSLITQSGPASVNVAAVMRQAGVSRTAFRRQFAAVYDVYAEILVDGCGTTWSSNRSSTPRLPPSSGIRTQARCLRMSTLPERES